MIDETAAYKDREVLVTGGLGFIGSNLVWRLAELGARVTVVDSLIPEYGGNLFNVHGLEGRVQVNISDVRDEHSLRYLVRGKELLFNLAGQTSHMDSISDPYTDLEINCKAQLSILEVCRHYAPDIKIIYASTRQIYGVPLYLPVDEMHLKRPVDVNGINKMAGEWYHIVYNNVHGLRGCVLRLTNTYGPRMRIKDARQTFLGTWLRLAVQGLPFEVWDGDQQRDLTYVDDAVDAFLLAGASDSTNGRFFNLGGAGPVTLRELADLLAEVTDGTYTVCPFPPNRKRIDIGDYYADYRAIHQALGWKPNVSIRDGLTRTVAYLRENLQEYL